MNPSFRARRKTAVINTLSQKIVPPLTCYKLDINDRITIIFGRNVTEKEIRRCFVFPSHLPSASALPHKIGNPEDSTLVHCACNTVQLGFLKFRNFNGGRDQHGQTASPCKILWWQVIALLRYGDFSIFRNGGRRHLGFLKFQNFNRQKGQRTQNASKYQILWWSVEPLRRYGDFSRCGRHHIGL